MPAIESSTVLRALASAISDVVVVLDRDGRYLDVVSRREELLVRPADELVDRTIHDVFPAESAALFVRWIAQVLDSGCTVEREYEVEIGGQRTCFAAVVALARINAAKVASALVSLTLSLVVAEYGARIVVAHTRGFPLASSPLLHHTSPPNLSLRDNTGSFVRTNADGLRTSWTRLRRDGGVRLRSSSTPTLRFVSER